ncbi:DNA cytosine methyltransferase [Paenibacillus xanthanilyticus]|uniref:DNA (cytosine-5-)-methyltransferase n=1 Tax=Paenibacillus xanthanilyticus TaxID=1783531 RepID=A0ABV8KA34_9BACL
MNALSLFSGIGGIDLAGEAVGIKTIAFCERERFPQQVLEKHWPGVPIYDDVRTLTKARLETDGILRPDRTIDLISAGYPCQPFSHAGKREGEKDDRHLWPEVNRLLQEIRPRWFLGENVAGHISLGLDTVLSDLENAGYDAQAFVIPASAVSASHQRERVFILGYTERSGLGGEPRRRAGEEPADGHSKLEGGPLANSESERCGKARGGISRSEERTTCSSDVADISGAGCQERDASSFTGDPRYGAGSRHEGRSDRSIESLLGRVADELPSWLDGSGINPLDALQQWIADYQQPALMGQEQYDWEPLRVATGIKNRASRLKALGNAVNPLQILPIMAAIKLLFHQEEKSNE